MQLISNQTGASYQWLDCNNWNTAILSETNQLFKVASNGNYAVAVTKNLCSDTSGCYSVISLGMNREERNRTERNITQIPPSTT